MSAGVTSPGRAELQQKTLRQDRWWLQPLVTFVVLAAFVVYATWRAFVGTHYYAAPYLSPFYSPCLSKQCVEGASDFGQPFGFWPLSPALLILVVHAYKRRRSGRTGGGSTPWSPSPCSPRSSSTRPGGRSRARTTTRRRTSRPSTHRA